jgi:hypothetical protein
MNSHKNQLSSTLNTWLGTNHRSRHLSSKCFQSFQFSFNHRISNPSNSIPSIISIILNELTQKITPSILDRHSTFVFGNCDIWKKELYDTFWMFNDPNSIEIEIEVEVRFRDIQILLWISRKVSKNWFLHWFLWIEIAIGIRR